MVCYTYNKGGVECQEQAHSRSPLLGPRGRSLSKEQRNIHHHILRLFAPRSFSSLRKGCKTSKSPNAFPCPSRSSVVGENVSFTNDYRVWTNGQGEGDLVFFPPQVVLEVKALACELPRQLGLPFSRLSCRDIAAEAVHSGIAASISGATVWRWLSTDAIRPWCYRSWIWPRDPLFAEKGGRVLDLYHRIWEGRQLGKDDYVVSCDEKTSIQARARIVPGTPPSPGRSRRVEHEYRRGGALAYIAAWDVHRAKLFGRCEQTTGIEPFHRLVDLVMSQEPYRSADRVFWITDNGSSHRSETSVVRLRKWYPNAILVHTPVHASWLNQIEIYFSILQRKVLTPNDFCDLVDLQTQIMDFQQLYESIAKPFEWKFTRADLNRIMAKVTLCIPAEQRAVA
jgi:hypothetical protein